MQNEVQLGLSLFGGNKDDDEDNGNFLLFTCHLHFLCGASTHFPYQNRTRRWYGFMYSFVIIKKIWETHSRAIVSHSSYEDSWFWQCTILTHPNKNQYLHGNSSNNVSSMVFNNNKQNICSQNSILLLHLESTWEVLTITKFTKQHI